LALKRRSTLTPHKRMHHRSNRHRYGRSIAAKWRRRTHGRLGHGT